MTDTTYAAISAQVEALRSARRDTTAAQHLVELAQVEVDVLFAARDENDDVARAARELGGRVHAEAVARWDAAEAAVARLISTVDDLAALESIATECGWRDDIDRALTVEYAVRSGSL